MQFHKGGWLTGDFYTILYRKAGVGEGGGDGFQFSVCGFRWKK